jgi:hypothetical protein
MKKIRKAGLKKIKKTGLKKIRKPVPQLRKRVQRRFRGYPVATIAHYGPTADLATKVVVSIIREEGMDPDPLQRWFSEGEDVRVDFRIESQIVAFLRQHGARTVLMPDRIIGCPHEEDIDYPEGKPCPQCPYWANRDRFTYERIQ